MSDNLNQLGKGLSSNNKEASTNVGRALEDSLKVQRLVDNFNSLTSFKQSILVPKDSSAYMDLRITELPVACSVNPPILDIQASAGFTSDNPGYFAEYIPTFNGPFQSTTVLDPPNPDFIVDSTGFVVPLDGCYSVYWTSSAWGVGYYDDKTVTVGITRNDYVIRQVQQTTTGGIHVLGPTIYVYTPASPIWVIVEARAGDKISAWLTQDNIEEGYPWIGHPEGLGGFFTGGGAVTVKLVAEAEGITTSFGSVGYVDI